MAISADKLDHCGVLLLPSAYLFPHNSAPLHIFEPRYRQMLNDALESDWVFAIGTLSGDETENFSECTHPIGTLGKIHNSKELDDGRSHLLLEGIELIHFDEWLPTSNELPYPAARISPVNRTVLPDSDAQSVNSLLIDSISCCLGNLPETAQSEIIGELSDLSPTHLIDTVAQHFIPCDDARLELLSEPCAKNRASYLLKYLHAK